MMKTSWKLDWWNDRFDAFRKGGWLLILFHFLIMAAYVLANNGEWVNLRNLIYLSVLTIFIPMYWKYDWKNNQINLFFSLFYMGGVGLEYFLYGLPHLIPVSSGVEKGIMLDMFLILYPYLYYTLRISLIIPILGVIYYRQKIESYH